MIARQHGIVALAFALTTACSIGGRRGPPSPAAGPIDAQATPETRALFTNLRAIAKSHVLFGHQDDLAYGYDWVGTPGRSDVKEASGSYPAVYGWEVAGLEKNAPKNIDGVDFNNMRGWIVEGYQRGGVITINRHMDNPVTGGNAWDTTSAVAAALPGGARHQQLVFALDRVAAFLGSLKAPTKSGNQAEVAIPVIFRPWHEMTGAWFWWGVPHTKGDEYVRLWQYTVRYLRDVKGLHNILYAYSPNAAGAPGPHPYLDGFPGDEYVDVLGYDSYFRGNPGPPGQTADVTRNLAWVVTQAEARKKIPAFTETGLQGLADTTFWTNRLARAIESDTVARRIAYVMVWRNANRAGRNSDHFFAPYRGQVSAADFVRMKSNPLFLFEDGLPDLYSNTPPR